MPEQAKASLECEAALAALRQYVQDMAAYLHVIIHDLKHPLGLVTGYAELLLQSGTALEDSARRDLMVINARAHDVVQIVEEMLPLACMDAAEKLELSAVDMGMALEQALASLADVITDLDAQLGYPDTWPKVLARSYWLEEIWVYVVGYALRFDGAPRRPRVQMGFRLELDGMVRFWVWDNAPPLSEEERNAVLLSLDQVMLAQEGKSALRLPMARYIIERLGGELSMTSAPTPDWHNEIFFTLPLASL